MLGSKKNLLYERDLDRFLWVDKIDRGAWVYGDSTHTRDIGVLLQALGANIDPIFDERHQQIWSTLRDQGTLGVPAHLALGDRTFKIRLSNLLNQLWMFLNNNIDNYYMNEFLIARRLLKSLQPCMINQEKYDRVIQNATSSTLPSLEKFKPNDQGFCQSPVYSQTGSVTGRLTVTGPNILTLKKAHREIFSSRFKNGHIVQIDLVSLEPRVALSIAGKESPPDIYSYISENILKNEINREITKIVTLSCIYGASFRSVASKIGDLDKARYFTKKIEDFFKISEISKRINNEIKQLGYYHNFYGRRLKDSNSKINHFIQSSSVDVSLLGFSRLMNDCQSQGLNVIPVFVIHDALIVDVDSFSLNHLRRIVDEGIKIPKIKFSFPAKIKDLYS